MNSNCIFCRVIGGDMPSFNLYEDDATLAFMDINPVHDGHALVVPREHAPDLFSLARSACGNFMHSPANCTGSQRYPKTSRHELVAVQR